jgi:two-component system sensor histidine kinase KdpD
MHPEQLTDNSTTPSPSALHWRRAKAAPRNYAYSLAGVMAVSLLAWPVRGLVEPTNLVALYLVIVLLVALYLGRGPAILASALSTVAFDCLFVPPYLTLQVDDTQYLITFAALLVVGVVISSLAARAREQAAAARRREAHALELYGLSRALAATAELGGVLRTLQEHLHRTLHVPAAVLLPDTNGLTVALAAPNVEMGADELAVAEWVWANNRPGGRDTATFPHAHLTHLPLHSGERVLGVLAVSASARREPLLAEERRLLDAFASLTSQAIQRIRLAEQASQVELLSATEALHAALLDSVSHDLRTPLASITGALSGLQDMLARQPPSASAHTEVQQELVDNALEQAERLNRLMANLLDMTRLQAGALNLRKEQHDVEDLIGSVLGLLSKRLGGRQMQVQLQPDMPLVPLDFVLMGQVLGNLLDNALKYSPSDTCLEITVRADEDAAEIALGDRGPGIPPTDLERVFEKFVRIPRGEESGGCGLGLPICRGIVAAHGGTLQAANRPGGGALFTIRLPLHDCITEVEHD